MISFVQRTLLALSLIVTLGAPQAHAFEFGVPTDAGNVMVETSRTINDTFLGAGQDVDIRGSIERDVIVAGETVGIHNTVGDNVFAAGKTVRIDGVINGGVIAVGQDIFIDKNTTIAGDIVVAGDTIHIDGTIQGTVRAYGRLIVISGTVGKNAILNGETVTLSSSAVVLGDLIGSIDKPLSKEIGARVDGKTDLDKSTSDEHGQTSKPMDRGMNLLVGIVISFLMGLICSAIMVTLTPKYVDRLRTLARAQPKKAALTGLVSMLLVFPLALLLLVLVVTVPIAFIVLAVFFLAVMLGHVVSYLYVGDLVSMAVAKKHWSAVGAIAAGALVLAILGYVPLIGMLAVAIASMLGAGTILLDLWDRLVHHTTK